MLVTIFTVEMLRLYLGYEGNLKDKVKRCFRIKFLMVY